MILGFTYDQFEIVMLLMIFAFWIGFGVREYFAIKYKH